jgi:hypothetical protein
VQYSFKYGFHRFLGSSRSIIAYASLPDAYTMGKSSCSSDAFSSQNRSKVISATSWGLALGLSILFITRMVSGAVQGIF